MTRPTIDRVTSSEAAGMDKYVGPTGSSTYYHEEFAITLDRLIGLYEADLFGELNYSLKMNGYL
jgi:hypothetical protein